MATPDETVVQAPALVLRADVRPDSIDTKARTVDIVFSTGAPVRRFDWFTGETYYESLSLKPEHVRLGRLNGGAPFLDAHAANRIANVLGVVVEGSAKLTDSEALASVRFSKRAEVEPIWADVRDGILRNVSVGYIPHKYLVTQATKDSPELRHAVDWEPYEISAVPVGADAGAQVRDAKAATYPCILVRAMPDPGVKKEPSMEPQGTAAADLVPEDQEERASETVANDADVATAEEQTRIMGIISACEAARLPMSTARKLITDKTKLVDAQSFVLDALRRRGGDDQGPRPGPSRVAVVGADPLETVWRGIGGALLHRMAPQYFELDDNARQYRTFSLMRTMEECLEQRGVRTRMLSRPDVVERALHTTSDFPNILADAANKTLRAAYAAAPQSWQPIARRIEAPDFKTMNRMQLGEAPALLKVLEHGEFKSGTIGEGKEQFALATYGRIFGITRQGLINDDLDAFGRVIVAFAQSARNLESDLVWYQILANAAMGDGVVLFDATSHHNYTTPGTAISVDALGVGRAAMRTQKGLDAITYLNLTARYLIVPPGKETLADQFTTQITPAQSSNVNPFTGRLIVIAEPRLEGGVTIDGVATAGSATAWYLAASLDQAIDIIEYAYLAGAEGPDIQTRAGFEIDGVQTRCRHDFAAKVIDWRGLYKNAGA
jgi:hypothetical protein